MVISHQTESSDSLTLIEVQYKEESRYIGDPLNKVLKSNIIQFGLIYLEQLETHKHINSRNSNSVTAQSLHSPVLKKIT